MRKELSQQQGERKKFTAIFSRLGKKTNFKGYSEDTILLIDIRDAGTNEILAGHLWFTYSKAFQDVTLEKGRMIEFEARIKSYRKGYVNKRAGINREQTDFRLSHPTKVRNVRNEG